MTRSFGSTLGDNRNRINAAFMLGAFAILGALSFEHIGGLYPCYLCLEQRWPYYIGLPVLAVVILSWNRLPPAVRIVPVLGVAALFVWGAGLGVYHSGVEWGIFEGPQACAGIGEAVSFDMLGAIDTVRIVSCDEVQWSFLGVSLAGFNAIISAVIAGLLGLSAWGQFKRLRA